MKFERGGEDTLYNKGFMVVFKVINPPRNTKTQALVSAYNTSLVLFLFE
jgi:hypothetical protein